MFFARLLATLVMIASCLAPPATARAAEAGDPAKGWEKAEADWDSWKKDVEDVIGPFELGLTLTGFYDWHDNAVIGGTRYPSLDGMGGLAQFTFDWNPVENGGLSGELRYGIGKGATGTMMDDSALLGMVNEIPSDMTSNHIQVYKLIWTQEMLDKKLFVAVGKDEQENYLDQNAYANNEFDQFVDQALVNDPVMDNEDEQMPMLALGGSPTDRLQIQGMVLASTQDGAKGEFDDILETPFVGAQAAYAATIGGHNGTYRLTGYSATYGHNKLSGNGKAPGFGAGLSFDQELTDSIGVFGRAYWHNEDVYEINWAFSGGVSATGLVPGREEDVLGLGAAFLVSDSISNTGGTETHLEAYYRFSILDHLFITPDIRYVANPKGLSANNGVLAAMLRVQLDL